MQVSTAEYVKNFASKAAAARAMGIPVTTLKHRLLAEARRSSAQEKTSLVPMLQSGTAFGW